MEIIFATSNRHKLSEAKGIIGTDIILITPADLGITESIPEDAPTLEENALFKARYLWEKTGRNVFADDTGLEVEALNGAPGVMSARYESEECDAGKNMQKLLKELKDTNNRKARFRTVVALIINGETHLFEGIVNGTILESLSGTGGFGYDPLFLPDGYTKTLAELSYEEKNLISHRGIAMRKLAEFLQSTQ